MLLHSRRKIVRLCTILGKGYSVEVDPKTVPANRLQSR